MKRRNFLGSIFGAAGVRTVFAGPTKNKPLEPFTLEKANKFKEELQAMPPCSWHFGIGDPHIQAQEGDLYLDMIEGEAWIRQGDDWSMM